MKVNIEPGWYEQMKDEFEKSYFAELVSFIKSEYRQYRIYPPGKQIFNAFQHCPFGKVAVVILGQDPYHGAGQANGLCFSVNNGIKLPPSLVNIFKEIRSDTGRELPLNGNLERWADQGVLLLNATLSVRAGNAGSHQKQGWETFTDAVIRKISSGQSGVVFMLWGAFAQQKADIIDENKHLILKSAHPSPFSADRGFFGCRHFSKANAYLKSIGKNEIDW